MIDRVRAALGPPCSGRKPGKRGPKTALGDEELVAEIQTVLSESPFAGEGHRKVRARLAAKGIREGCVDATGPSAAGRS